MLAEILRAVVKNGTLSIGDLSRMLGASNAAVLRAIADLTREGYIECGLPSDSQSGCGSACAGCRALPECRLGSWRLTGKAAKFLDAG
jgi:hypothetical protein